MENNHETVLFRAGKMPYAMSARLGPAKESIMSCLFHHETADCYLAVVGSRPRFSLLVFSNFSMNKHRTSARFQTASRNTGLPPPPEPQPTVFGQSLRPDLATISNGCRHLLTAGLSLAACPESAPGRIACNQDATLGALQRC